MVAVACVLGAGWPAGASARDAEELVRVLSPTRGQGVFANGAAVRVVVRRGARLTVWMSGRKVTRALKLRTVRKAGRARTVRGRIPRRLVRGAPKALEFRARAGRRRDGDHVLVQAVKRRPGFMRLRLQRRTGRAPAEAVIRTREHRIWLRATLNGRRIERVSKSRRLGVRRLRLTRTEGLRHGRNVLVVAANDARGRGDLERRVFFVSRRDVIPGVRHLDRVRVHAPVILDAGPSVPVPAGGRLSYRWRFAARPEGSRAKLRGPTRRRVRFVPDVPGHYSVRLTARPAGGGRRAAAAQVGGSLVADVTAQAPISPYGLHLKTDPSEGVTLEDTTIGLPTPPDGMLVVAIDAATGAIVQNTAVPSREESRDVPNFMTALQAVNSDPGKIVIAMGARGDGDVGDQDQLSKLFPGLDAKLQQALAGAIVKGQPFAYVGVPGSPAGAATVNVSVDSAAGGVLDGRLRLTGLDGLTGKLVFEQPDYRFFAINGAASPTSVTEIDAPAGTTPTNWIDQPLAADESMRVTVIDAVTLTTTFFATAPFDDCDPGELSAVAGALQRFATDPSQLILFKMSGGYACVHQRDNLAQISHLLASLGANRDIFLRSLFYPGNSQFDNNTSDYVFFGGEGIEGVEGSRLITAATSADGQSGSVQVSPEFLTGVLRKNNRGQWEPVAAKSSDKLTGELQALATRAPVGYGYPTNVAPGTQAQYAAAEQRMYNLLVAANVLCKAGEPGCKAGSGVRVNYANQDLLGGIGIDNTPTLELAQNELLCRPDGTTTGTLTPDSDATYTQAQLNALQAQVCTELDALTAVHDKLVTQLGKVYADIKGDSTLELLNNTDDYLAFLRDEADAQLAQQNEQSFLGISGEAGDVLGDLFTGATDVAEYLLAADTGGASIFVGTAIGDALTVGGDSIGLASGAKGVGEQADQVAPELVTVSSLITYIQDSYRYAESRLEEIEALITSDPTKLTDAEAQVRAGDWDLTQSINSGHQLSDVIEYQQAVAVLQYQWPRMISATVTPCDVGGSADDPTTYEAWTRLDVLPHADEPNYLGPSPHRLRSAHLTSSDAKTLATKLFGAPNVDSNALDEAPNGAALAKSPFFMVQIAPTTTSTAESCTESADFY